MAKPALTLGSADNLADLLRAAPAKPEAERVVELDAYILRLADAIRLKLDQHGWTPHDIAAWLVANGLHRPVGDVRNAIKRVITIPPPSLQAPRRKRSRRPRQTVAAGRTTNDGQPEPLRDAEPVEPVSITNAKLPKAPFLNTSGFPTRTALSTPGRRSRGDEV